jgi:hypothetical protein
MATSLIFGTGFDVVLKIFVKHLSTYFYPTKQRAIYLRE